jgi:hypothetical protein
VDFPEEYYFSDTVIKTNHGWGTNIFPVKDNLERDEIDRRIQKAMGQRHGRNKNQWAYCDITPRLFVEELVVGDDELIELKILTYGRSVLRVVPIRSLKNDQRIASVWEPDRKGRLTRTERASAVSPNFIDKSPLPTTANQALAAAREIGQHFDHMRVDFLTVGNVLFLGEITVYNLSGWQSDGHHLGAASTRHWDLRRSWFLSTPQTGWRATYAKALSRFCDRQAKSIRSLDSSGPLSPELLQRGLLLARSLGVPDHRRG